MTTRQQHTPEPLDPNNSTADEIAKYQAIVQWIPSTHHQVPQPAGKQCADWYVQFQPSATDILYALAHTKGQRDNLAESLRECIEAVRADLNCSWTGGLRCPNPTVDGPKFERAEKLLAALG